MAHCHRNNFSRVSNEFPLEGLRNTMIILEAVSQLELSSQRERHSDFHIYPSVEVEIHPSVLLSPPTFWFQIHVFPDQGHEVSDFGGVLFYTTKTPTKCFGGQSSKSKVIWHYCLCKLPLNHIFKMLGPLRIIVLHHRCRQLLSFLPCLHSTRAVPQGKL